jgi:hypothetical protein
MDKNFNFHISAWASEPNETRKNRGICGAMTRRGTPCQAPPVWDKSTDTAKNGRCKLHGGMSTGVRTEAGREAIRESNRRRKKPITAEELKQFAV